MSKYCELAHAQLLISAKSSWQWNRCRQLNQSGVTYFAVCARESGRCAFEAL